MRAGKLDQTIIIERPTTIVDDYGTPTEGWATIATVRAQRLQSSTAEFIEGYGADFRSVVVFRIRHRDGITLADRISHAGNPYNLVEIKPLGRREGIELRCTASGN
ncbi:phage head closure protein [Rhizobium sp. GN54]|uniref:phage head closure protein n=1 Tax=Rhizobium sp. GN54 TaxID=2898150 RepID=UPI001E38668A|nr:phage head closure protein [Rhizobium sp. GN54]MCD2185220.1 phage head closure protein [Rhizobium sp. GN54]